MANKIQLRRGQKANMPNLAPGEPAVALDTGQLFIGTDAGNKEIGAGGGYDFDAVPSGYEYSYSKNGNVYTETIKNTATQTVYATRTSTKVSNTQWTIRTICSDKSINKTEVWTKTNGIWKGEIS